MIRRSQPLAFVVARLVLALAIAMAAFSPASVAYARGGAIDLAAFSFPDGSTPVICLGDTDGDGIGDGVIYKADPALSAQAFDLPTPAALPFRPPVRALPSASPLTVRMDGLPAAAPPPARAPPVASA